MKSLVRSLALRHWCSSVVGGEAEVHFLVRVTPRPTSPAWHRRARAKRHKARQVLKQLKYRGTHCLTGGFARRVASSLGILRAHHSWPCYRNHPMGGWNHGKGKQKSQWWTHWDGAYRLQNKDIESSKGKGAEKKKEQKGNKGEKEPHKSFSFPDYDFSSSSASSSSKQQLEEEVRKEVLKCLKASGVEPSESLSELLNAEPEQLSNLKEEQKTLNQRKKLLLKIEKIKKRMKQKKEAWEVFEATVQQHVSKQVAKHKEDMQAL